MHSPVHSLIITILNRVTPVSAVTVPSPLLLLPLLALTLAMLRHLTNCCIIIISIIIIIIIIIIIYYSYYYAVSLSATECMVHRRAQWVTSKLKIHKRIALASVLIIIIIIIIIITV